LARRADRCFTAIAAEAIAACDSPFAVASDVTAHLYVLFFGEALCH
jgi:hypothetical protein